MLGVKAVLLFACCATTSSSNIEGFLKSADKDKQGSALPLAAIEDATSLQEYHNYGGQGGYAGQSGYGAQGGYGGQSGGGYGSYQQPRSQSRLEQWMPSIIGVLLPIVILVCVCCCIMHLCGDICGCLCGNGSYPGDGTPYGPGAMAMAGGAGMLAGYEMDQMRGNPGYGW